MIIQTTILSLVIGWGFYQYSRWPNVSLLKKRNPHTTALMALRDAEYRSARQKPRRQQIWVPYGAISENLKRAILLGEDAAFFVHRGVDLVELKESLWEDWEEGRFKRGGSTITMQLAKNLYLNPSKNPLRKLKEILLAWHLEQTLSKQRIFELYLNVVEWGSGIYGAEAAARHYFSKSAAQIDIPEAATLAALLPNPRNPEEKGLAFRRNIILARLLKYGFISEEEFDRASAMPLF